MHITTVPHEKISGQKKKGLKDTPGERHLLAILAQLLLSRVFDSRFSKINTRTERCVASVSAMMMIIYFSVPMNGYAVLIIALLASDIGGLIYRRLKIFYDIHSPV